MLSAIFFCCAQFFCSIALLSVYIPDVFFCHLCFYCNVYDMSRCALLFFFLSMLCHFTVSCFPIPVSFPMFIFHFFFAPQPSPCKSLLLRCFFPFLPISQLKTLKKKSHTKVEKSHEILSKKNTTRNGPRSRTFSFSHLLSYMSHLFCPHFCFVLFCYQTYFPLNGKTDRRKI